MVNEVDIDFRIPGLPHSVVKQAENCRVRKLVKQIENHPRRPSVQRDLQQNNAYNPFSEKSKKMIQNVGNVELFELFETDPKSQCKEFLLYWSQGICEGVGDVVGVEAPLGGVAQVIFHGVQVVKVGVQVRVHQDRGEEEDGEGQVQVEREVDEDQRERHMCNMA